MFSDYIELRCRSWYSFGGGASSVSEVVSRAASLGYPALGLADRANLCGSLEFAQACDAVGIRAIHGAALPVSSGGQAEVVTLLAESGPGYSNICRMVSLAHEMGGRTSPELDSRLLREHRSGVIALARTDRPDFLRELVSAFGAGSVFADLRRHLVRGELWRNRRVLAAARAAGAGVSCSNGPWYHSPSRARLHDALAAVRLNSSLSALRGALKPNSHWFLKSPGDMAALFGPNDAGRRALLNTAAIAERCSGFSLVRWLRDRYSFPEVPLPAGYNAQSWLERLCLEAAERRYGRIGPEVRERLDREFFLIRRHGLAGFFLVYRRVAELAREVMAGLGCGDAETPLEWLPPGRGRGSSVSMLTGFLIGLSHVDPLACGLSLDRFLSEDTGSFPDIDLDFPRDVRERLIPRVIEEWGWDHAALAGQFSTYRARGIVRSLGLALGLPGGEVDAVAKRLEGNDVGELLPHLPDRTGWRELSALAPQLAGFPRGLSQHPGGMLVSAPPLTDFVPVQPSAIAGRYLVQWDKDSAEDAGMVKMDLLGLGALSQMRQAVRLVRERTGVEPDLSGIDYRDPGVFDDLARGDTVGVFQVESAAQMQTIVRMRPRDISDLALEVAAVRPGVGANDGVAEFLRRRGGAPWSYDHPLERAALGRSLGVIMFQDQVVRLGMDVAGFTAAAADRMRRAVGRRGGAGSWRDDFVAGAAGRGVPEKVAERIFGKFNPHYMFPEGHALAFAFTAYQMAWLRRYRPLEFYVALFNEQPMGFWDLDTLKQDARRLGLRVAHPCVNRAGVLCRAEGVDVLRLGLAFVKGVDRRLGESVLAARAAGGEFRDLPDFLSRTAVPREALENLVLAGAFDRLAGDRRRALWLAGSGVSGGSRRGQLRLPLAGVEPDFLPPSDRASDLLGEYSAMGLSPGGHVMELLRPGLRGVVAAGELSGFAEGDEVRVAGRVVRRQRPLARAVFLTLEDETGLAQVAVWEGMWPKLKGALRGELAVVEGAVSRRDGTLSVAASRAWPLDLGGFVGGGGRRDWR